MPELHLLRHPHFQPSPGPPQVIIRKVSVIVNKYIVYISIYVNCCKRLKNLHAEWKPPRCFSHCYGFFFFRKSC